MKFQDIILFLALFGVFFAALNISFSPHRDQLVLCDPRLITQLQIKNEKGAILAKLDQDNAEWFLFTNGSKDKGDYRTLDFLTKAVCVFPYVEKIDVTTMASEKEWRALGLKKASQEIAIVADHHEQTLFFGNTTPSGTEFYFMTSTIPNSIFTVPNKLLEELSPSLMDLRQHAIFEDLKLGDEFTLKFGDITIILKSDNKGWYDETQTLSREQAQILIKTAQIFSYKNYHDDVTNEKLTSYGFDYPDITLEWRPSGASNKQRYDMALFNGRHYLTMRTHDETYILILNKVAPEAFFKELHAIAAKFNSVELE